MRISWYYRYGQSLGVEIMEIKKMFQILLGTELDHVFLRINKCIILKTQ